MSRRWQVTFTTCLWLSGLAMAITGGPGPAQTTSGSLAGEPLAVALNRLRAEGLNLVFSERLIHSGLRVKTEPKSSQPFERLMILLGQHGFTVQPGPGATILIVKGNPDTPIYGTKLIGRLVHREHGAPITAEHIKVHFGEITVTNNDLGHFHIDNLTPGEYQIQIQSDRWLLPEPMQLTLGFGETIRFDLPLVPLPLHHETIQISQSIRTSHYRLHWHAGAEPHHFSSAELDPLPRLGNDPYRALARLPGSQTNGLSARFRIRGGTENEVLVLFNGLELQAPFHLQGFLNLLSVFDAALIGNMDFSSGGFPAQYGTRMSGVVTLESIRSSEPNWFQVEANTLHGKVMGGGRFAGGAGQWLASARYGILKDRGTPKHSDWEADYDDTFVSVDYRIGTDWLIQANFLRGSDHIDFLDFASVGDPARVEIDLDGTHQQEYVWLNAQRSWNERLDSTWVLAAGSLERTRLGFNHEDDFFFFPNRTQRFFAANDRRDQRFIAFKQAWRLQLGTRHSLNWGGEWRRLRATFQYKSRHLETSPIVIGEGLPQFRELDLSPQVNGERLYAYLSHQVRWLSGWQLSTGLRLDHQSYTQSHRRQWSPRLNLAYTWSDRGRWTIALGRFSQAQDIGELQVEDGVDRFQEAQIANHAVMGIEQDFGEGISLRIDAYYKRIANPTPRFDNSLNPLSLFPEGEPGRTLLTPERASISGLEWMLKRDDPVWSWFVNYSYSDAHDTLAGKRVARSWDHRHQVNASISLRTQSGWALNLSGHYRSGRPFTDIQAEAIRDELGQFQPRVVLGPHNGARLSGTMRWDLRISRAFIWGRSRFEAMIELANLSEDPRNCCVRYEFFLNPVSGEVARNIDKPVEVPAVPVVGFRWRF